MAISHILVLSVVLTAVLGAVSAAPPGIVNSLSQFNHTAGNQTNSTPPAPLLPTTTTTAAPGRGGGDSHQTVMIVIYVLCGLFAWLCIVKTCCSIFSERSIGGGAIARRSSLPRRRSAQEANEMWDEIRRTPPTDDKRQRLLDHDTVGAGAKSVLPH